MSTTRRAAGDRYYLGSQLAVLHKRRGITQVELAPRSGVEQADIGKIERGISDPMLRRPAARLSSFR